MRGVLRWVGAQAWVWTHGALLAVAEALSVASFGHGRLLLCDYRDPAKVVSLLSVCELLSL
jgi:hypothetical protein